MKVVILAGGLGTRLSEETHSIPKPMVRIGGKPILWHIMKIYSHYGFNDFIICGGYKQEVIQNYLLSYESIWDKFGNVHLVDTGENTLTGGRIKLVQEFIGNETFLLTYGDGISNINISELVKFHKFMKKSLTVSSVQPSGRFGGMDINPISSIVEKFNEKPKGDGIWINGGFMVCEPKIFDYIDGDNVTFEAEPINKLVEEREVVSYKHHGFWECMDTLKDKNDLNKMWNENKAEWKVWG